jgi:hypothetical protein
MQLVSEALVLGGLAALLGVTAARLVVRELFAVIAVGEGTPPFWITDATTPLPRRTPPLPLNPVSRPAACPCSHQGKNLASRQWLRRGQPSYCGQAVMQAAN